MKFGNQKNDKFLLQYNFSVQLEKNIMAKGNVELWLGELLEMQMKSLHAVIREAAVVINEPGFQLLSFAASYIAQASQNY